MWAFAQLDQRFFRTQMHVTLNRQTLAYWAREVCCVYDRLYLLRAGRWVQPRPEGLSAVKGHGAILVPKKTGQDLDGCGMRSGFLAMQTFYI